MHAASSSTSPVLAPGVLKTYRRRATQIQIRPRRELFQIEQEFTGRHYRCDTGSDGAHASSDATCLSPTLHQIDLVSNNRNRFGLQNVLFVSARIL